jgi:hypothetical protein
MPGTDAAAALCCTASKMRTSREIVVLMRNIITA